MPNPRALPKEGTPGAAGPGRSAQRPAAVKRESFRNVVNELPELVGVFLVSGSADVLLHVAVPDTNALYGFVIDRLTERPEVAYEHVRRTVREPL